jgi:ElaA protein
MQIDWSCVSFGQLSLTELYEILALRTEVFIVEQNCPFQDQDGKKDFESFHLLGKNDKHKIIAYTRLLPAGLAYNEVSIGRVVSSLSVRGSGIGKILMKKSIETCIEKYGNLPIKIGAQLYLKSFYESFGFVKSSITYLEDGIEHIEMVRVG